ncbi:Protein ABERRANT PANICLE ORGANIZATION 1 [Euphorbia peplus]|nr:Protein ABERRANT PANICLE ORGANIZATION 1 [Euphorbia peplus]
MEAAFAAAYMEAFSTPWMDPRIWSRLPLKLLDRVVAFLPPPSFFRARSVCKRWYSLLFSHSFLQLYFHISPLHRHFFLFFHHKPPKTTYIYQTTPSIPTPQNPIQGYLFDPYDFTWYRIPFPQIPSSGFSPVASSGGLICWVSDEAGTKSLLLSNPLTGSISQVPLTLKPRLLPSIGLVTGFSSIDITVAGDNLISPYAVKNLSSESFHVDAGGFYSLWGTNASLPRQFSSLESGEMIFAGGKIYCMNHNPYCVMAYEMSSNVWVELKAPMKRYLRCPSLLESRGRLIVVADIKKIKLSVPKSFRIWRLESCGKDWFELDKMPQQLYDQFTEIEGGRGFSCVGHGEFIVVVIRGSDKGLVYDMCRKRWEWMPACPYVHGGDELHGFAYEPRLAVPVTALLDHFTIPF